MRQSTLRITILMIYNSRLNSSEKNVLICIAANAAECSKRIDVEVISRYVSLSFSVVEKILTDLERLGYLVVVECEMKKKKYTTYTLSKKIMAEYEAIKTASNAVKSIPLTKELAYKDE